MTKIFKESDKVQEKLSTYAEKSKENYEKLLNTNLVNEKMIREQKSKIQQNLKNWVNKYDLEIGERSKQLSDSKELLDQKQKEFNSWKLEFEEQEREQVSNSNHFLSNSKHFFPPQIPQTDERENRRRKTNSRRKTTSLHDESSSHNNSKSLEKSSC